MRLIDADKLIKEMLKPCPFVLDTTTYDNIYGIPIVDAVEVVRCKDCKYASPNGKYGCKAYHFKLYETHEMEADDFCSRGERK